MNSSRNVLLCPSQGFISRLKIVRKFNCIYIYFAFVLLIKQRESFCFLPGLTRLQNASLGRGRSNCPRMGRWLSLCTPWLEKCGGQCGTSHEGTDCMAHSYEARSCSAESWAPHLDSQMTRKHPVTSNIITLVAHVIIIIAVTMQ